MAAASALPTSTPRRTCLLDASQRAQIVPCGTHPLRVLAADGDDLAGHVAGVVAGEEDDHVGDLPRLRRATEGLARHELVDGLPGHDLRQVLVDGQARS